MQFTSTKKAAVLVGGAVLATHLGNHTVVAHEIDMDLPETSSVAMAPKAITAGDIASDDNVYLATTCSPKVIETQECQVVTITSEEVPEPTPESITTGDISSEIIVSSATSTTGEVTSSPVEETPEPTSGAASKSGVKSVVGALGLLAAGVYITL